MKILTKRNSKNIINNIPDLMGCGPTNRTWSLGCEVPLTRRPGRCSGDPVCCGVAILSKRKVGSAHESMSSSSSHHLLHQVRPPPPPAMPPAAATHGRHRSRGASLTCTSQPSPPPVYCRLNLSLTSPIMSSSAPANLPTCPDVSRRWAPHTHPHHTQP
jgi:hypothetical protein